MTDTMSKALEAAAEALLTHDDGYCLGEHSVPERAALNLAQAAISAYLAHLAEDEEVVRVAMESIGPSVNEADIRCMFRDIARALAGKE